MQWFPIFYGETGNQVSVYVGGEQVSNDTAAIAVQLLSRGIFLYLGNRVHLLHARGDMQPPLKMKVGADQK